MSNQYQRNWRSSGILLEITNVATLTARLAFTPVSASNEYRFRQALRNSAEQLHQARNDVEQQCARKTHECHNILTSSDRLGVQAGGQAARALLLQRSPRAQLGQSPQSKATQKLIAYCNDAINQNIGNHIIGAKINVELPKALFDGAVITLKKHTSGWTVSAKTFSERSRCELQMALPHLQQRLLKIGIYGRHSKSR